MASGGGCCFWLEEVLDGDRDDADLLGRSCSVGSVEEVSALREMGSPRAEGLEESLSSASCLRVLWSCFVLYDMLVCFLRAVSGVRSVGGLTDGAIIAFWCFRPFLWVLTNVPLWVSVWMCVLWQE